MERSPSALTVLLLALLSAPGHAAPLLPTPSGASDPPAPFAPGERWSHAADPASPWIPTSVAFAAGGELVLGLAGFASPGLQVHAAGASGSSLLYSAPLSAGIQGNGSLVLAHPDLPLALTLEQLPLAGSTAKTTSLVARDLVAAAAGGTLAVRWSHDPGFSTTAGGLAAVASGPAGAALVVLALRDDTTGLLHVNWLDLESGALVGTASVPAGLLRALAVSADAKRVALSAGMQLFVLDATGTLLHAESLSAATPALDLSADGATLLVGGVSELRVLREVPGSGYAEQHSFSAAPWELAARCALAADGSTLGVAWWNYTTGRTVRFELWSADGAVRYHSILQAGPPGGPQNWPSALALTADGRRALFGSWGASDAGPELLLVDRDQPAPLLAVDTGGSLLTAALAADGTRVVAGIKSTHAGVFATTGAVRLFDTGERDLQVLGAPTLGGSLHLAHRSPGNLYSLFALGQPSSGAWFVPGVAGAFLLEPQGLVWFQASADASGRSDRVLSLPAAPVLAGLQPWFQALALTANGARWSARTARPWLGF